MTAQPSGDMSDDDVAVVKFHRKRRTRENLFDAANYFDGALFSVLRRVSFRLTPTLFSNSITCGYGNTP